MLMIVNAHFPVVQRMRAQLAYVITPFFYIANAPAQLSHYLLNSFTSRQALQQENANLRARQIVLQAQLQKYIAIQKENDKLRELLASTPRGPGRIRAAQLLSVSSNPARQTILLDKGKRQKVFAGQAVFDATGVMGQVIEVTPLTSRVMLLTDEHSAIPVQVNRSNERGIVVGTGGSGYLKLINIPQTTQIQVGDMLVTSGLGRHFPEGYPVGLVKAVVHKPGDTFADITVKPTAQVNRSRLVLLHWPNNQEKQLTRQLKQKNHG